MSFGVSECNKWNRGGGTYLSWISFESFKPKNQHSHQLYLDCSKFEDEQKKWKRVKTSANEQWCWGGTGSSLHRTCSYINRFRSHDCTIYVSWGAHLYGLPITLGRWDRAARAPLKTSFIKHESLLYLPKGQAWFV